MLTRRPAIALTLVLLSPAGRSEGESIRLEDGRRVAGQLAGDARAGFRFVPEGGGTPRSLETLESIQFDGPGADRVASPPPFRVLMADGGRVSGTLAAVTDEAVRLKAGPDGRPIDLERRAVAALLQRPGEAIILSESFDALDLARWKAVGGAIVQDDDGPGGGRSLRLPASGGQVAWHAAEPIGAGRIELSFRDDARRMGLVIELGFRAASGLEPVTVVLGREEDGLAVRSRGEGPSLAVQRLPRRPGRHLLTARFGPDRIDLAIDGDELAHGEGPPGPLAALRIAAEGNGPNPPTDLAGIVEDVRVVRMTTSSIAAETVPDQDEARLVTGDQLFGRIASADRDGVVFLADGRRVALGWDETAGLYFRRESAASSPIEGLWVRLSWRETPTTEGEPDVLEGALVRLDKATLTLDSPFIGRVVIPRRRVVDLRVLGRMRRTVLDPSAHHLGNTVVSDLDPPQPEGSGLELEFELEAIPDGPSFLAMTVVQVVGVEGDPDFSAAVRRGELLTGASLNGRPFDTLNRHVTTRNDTPARIRLPIPAGLLRAGRNVLKIEQAGLKADPGTLDNLGLRGVCLETVPPNRAAATVKILTRSLVRHAHAVAREVGARVILLSADVVEEDADLSSLIQDVDFRVILVSRRPAFKPPDDWADLASVVRVPDIAMTRAGLMKVATLIASVEGLVHAGDRVVWLTGLDSSGTIDTLMVLDLGSEGELFGTSATDPLPADVKPAVFERLLTIASELGLEGREGRPVGTIFILGDSDRVLAHSRQLVINPFHGYPEEDRNILDPRLEETIKEFSAIDGAFIVRGDGVVLASARYLAPSTKPDEPLPQGLGTRHEAAAGITAETDAVALCVSQSTGTVSIFKRGRLVADIQKPRSTAGGEL